MLGGADLQKRKICRETRTIAALFALGDSELVVLPFSLRRFLVEGNVAYRVGVIFSGGMNLSKT
jgi:hypothetical protein